MVLPYFPHIIVSLSFSGTRGHAHVGHVYLPRLPLGVEVVADLRSIFVALWTCRRCSGDWFPCVLARLSLVFDEATLLAPSLYAVVEVTLPKL